MQRWLEVLSHHQNSEFYLIFSTEVDFFDVSYLCFGLFQNQNIKKKTLLVCISM